MVHIFTFIITTYWKMFIGIKFLNWIKGLRIKSVFPILPRLFALPSSCLLSPPGMDCPTTSPKPTVWGKPGRLGPSSSQKKKKIISHTRKSFLTKQQFSCDHPIQASFIAASLLLYHFFNFRLYVKIYHATFDYSMVTKSYLQHDKRTEWSKFLQAKLPTPFCTFQCYLENQAPIIACCPFYSFHFSFQT